MSLSKPDNTTVVYIYPKATPHPSASTPTLQSYTRPTESCPLPHISYTSLDDVRICSAKEQRTIIQLRIYLLALSSVAMHTCSCIRELIGTIRDSSTLEGRARHGILTPIATPRLLRECDTAWSRVMRFYDAHAERISRLDPERIALSKEDCTERWYVMTEQMMQFCEPAFHQLDLAIKQVFKRIVRPADPTLFYRCITCLYRAAAFDNLLHDIARFVDADLVRPFRILDLVHLTLSIIRQIAPADSEGIRLFLVTDDSDDEYKKFRRSSHYLGQRIEGFRCLYCQSLWQTEEIRRANYAIMCATYSFDHCEQAFAAAGICYVKPLKKYFRHEYSEFCMSSYEQYQLNINLFLQRYSRVLPLAERFVASLPLYRGKPTQPVLGFPYVDTPSGREVRFLGVWHSASAAARETGFSSFDIMRYRRYNQRLLRLAPDERHTYKLDKHGIAWISVELLIERVKYLIKTNGGKE